MAPSKDRLASQTTKRTIGGKRKRTIVSSDSTLDDALQNLPPQDLPPADFRVSKMQRIESPRVFLVVGPQQRLIQAHRDVLCQSSKFFNSALTKDWEEARKRTITLPEDDPNVVGTYVEWLYSKKMASMPNINNFTLDDIRQEYQLLSSLYIFGDRYSDDEFCNAVMTALAMLVDDTGSDGFVSGMGTDTIRMIYDATVPGSPLRQFCVDMQRKYGSRDWLNLNGLQEHVEFLSELVAALLDDSSAPRQQHKQHAVYNLREQWFKQCT